jgi:hypothetical protein
MMSASVIWFSHPPDYHRLRESIDSVRSLDGTVGILVCVKDGVDPPDIDGVTVIIGDFPQGHKLAGCETVMGIARTLAMVRTGLVVKLDSDMRVLTPFWRSGEVLFRRRNRSIAGVYALSGEVARRVAESFAENPTRGGHEAIEIGLRALSLGHVKVIEISETLPDCVEMIA